MQIIGIGIDILDIKRFGNSINKWGDLFINKIFTINEQKYIGAKDSYYMHMSGKFAAKEAVKKAIPNGAEIGLDWTSIEILKFSDGKPYVNLHKKAKQLKEQFQIKDIFISISHSKNFAVANAIVIK